MSTQTPLSRMQTSVEPATLARHLEWFSHVPRDTGGEGEARAAAYIAAELEAAGLPVTSSRLWPFPACRPVSWSWKSPKPC